MLFRTNHASTLGYHKLQKHRGTIPSHIVLVFKIDFFAKPEIKSKILVLHGIFIIYGILTKQWYIENIHVYM